MTRINCVPVEELCNKHLMAEYRELPRLYSNLMKSLQIRGLEGTLNAIPDSYRLGKGHVLFFLDKFDFLRSRYETLVAELLIRGYNINEELANSVYVGLSDVPDEFFNNWCVSDSDMELNRNRIKERMPINPKWELNK
jgi:deoxyribonuclease (pyrimidine dimer)